MIILGISAFYHDSAACLVINDVIVSAAQEERFNRIKHYSGFPVNAVKYCLEAGKITMADIDYVAYYEKPLLKFERLIKTFYRHAPFGFLSFATGLKPLINKQLFFQHNLIRSFKKIDSYHYKKLRVKYAEHHLSHAGSSFFASSFKEAAILTIDGVGEWSTASIFHGLDNQIKVLKELEYPNSLGLFYSSFTYFLGFKVNLGEYKLMGLAPYGNPTSNQTKNFKIIILSNLIEIFNDGSIRLNPKFFSYSYSLKMIDIHQWERLFGITRRAPKGEIRQEHCNLAYAIQNVIEKIIYNMAKEAKRLTNCKNLCLAGGVALNSAAVGKLIQKNLFNKIYVQPASGDAGGAVGSALATNYIFLGRTRKIRSSEDVMNFGYLGPEFTNQEINKFNFDNNLNFKYYEDYIELAKLVALKIAQGNIVGWFQGRMEFGPRALGNRSILADARNPEIQLKINRVIKQRETFRPLAPSILYEDLSTYFESERFESFMSSTVLLKQGKRKKMPKNYSSFSILDKLKVVRSDLQSIVHVDFTSRIQTVKKDANPKFWRLLIEFKELTNCPVLLNTSFNTDGEPIVCSPQDAYMTFQNSNLDCLVMNNFIYLKQ